MTWNKTISDSPEVQYDHNEKPICGRIRETDKGLDVEIVVVDEMGRAVESYEHERLQSEDEAESCLMDFLDTYE